MTIREINPAQASVESKHRPNASTNSDLPPLKLTVATPHSDTSTTHQPLRAKRKSPSISNQGHNNNGGEGLVPAPDRDQEVSMQDSTAQSWEDRRITTKQLRLTAVDSGRRRRTSICTQFLRSGPSSSSSGSPNSTTLQSTASNRTENNTISLPSTHIPDSNGGLVYEMDLDTHISSPSTVSADVDVASLGDTLDVSILEEDLLVRQIRDLSSPPSPPLLQVSRQPPLFDSLDDNNSQTPTHQQLIEDARAGKKVDRKGQQLFTKPNPPILPTELLIKVFEWLAGYQSDLCSAALVSIEWNLCATGQLYRYPEFANTIHWAMFIQTLCKNKEDELKKPISRRYRPPIITPTCLSPHLGDHPPILLAPEQMANFGARTQQPRRRDRLDRALGDYVRGIDLSRRAIGVSRLCSCGRPYGPPVAMKECSVCSRPGKSSRSKPVVGSTIRSTSGETCVIQGDDDDDDGSEIDDCDMGDLDYLTVRPSLTAMRGGFRLGSQQAPNDRLGQSSQVGFDSTGLDPASNDTLPMLEWSELQLSSTTDFDRLIRPIVVTGTNSTTAAAICSTTITTPTAAISSSSSTTTATTAGPSLIALARLKRLAANGRKGEKRLTSQDAVSQSTAKKASPSEGGGSGSRGKVVIEKDASSTRKPMMITVSSLIQMARHCPNLEWLCLASTALADDTLYLETGDYMSTLQPGPRTGLTNVQVTVMEGIGALGQSCPNLGRVWLVGCDWVTHREVLALTTSCRRLQMMDVRHCARLEGRLSRLYMIIEGQDINNDEPLHRAEDTDADVGSNVIRNERVATPLNFETAPTTVLLGANVSGRGVRDGAMDDLFYWVYITAVVGSSGNSSTATATVVPTTNTTTSTTATTSPPATASSSTIPAAYNPQAVNEILSLLSSVALAREAPTDPLAFREWFKAIKDYDLVSYQPLKRLKSRYPMSCRPGEQKISGGGIESANSSSSSTNSSGYNNTDMFFIANSSSRRIRREQRQQQGRFDTGSGSDSESDSDSSSGSGAINQQQQPQHQFGAFDSTSDSDSDSRDEDSVDGITEENLAELDG